ncbi:Hypothetical protein R9X50_00543600 [Acrodontium crateriforme]|uniref:Uncharacterized protein n=1 Tax=Acrodontium crateriforme TaxID=150365 RepID=A0AAQ3R5Y1_9PEZI|nr:Hypothetical protein R9X50_00543600 [Acrodontium crateriforme]
MISFSGLGWDPDYRKRSVSLGLSKENVMRGTPSATEIVLSPCQWGSVRGKARMIELPLPDSPSQRGYIREYSSPSSLNTPAHTLSTAEEPSPSKLRRKTSGAIAALEKAHLASSEPKSAKSDKRSEEKPESRRLLRSRPSVGARRNPDTVAAQKAISPHGLFRDLTAESSLVTELRDSFCLKQSLCETKTPKGEKDASFANSSKLSICETIPATEELSLDEGSSEDESPEQECYVMDTATENNTMRNCSGSYTTVTLPVRRGLGLYFNPAQPPREPQRRKFRIREIGSTTDSIKCGNPPAPVLAGLDAVSSKTTGRRISILLPPSKSDESNSTEENNSRKDSSVSVVTDVDSPENNRMKNDKAANNQTCSQPRRIKIQHETDDNLIIMNPWLQRVERGDSQLSFHVETIFEGDEWLDGSSSDARPRKSSSGTWVPEMSNENEKDSKVEYDDSDKSIEEIDDNEYFLASLRRSTESRNRRYRLISSIENRRKRGPSGLNSDSTSTSERDFDDGNDRGEGESPDASPTDGDSPLHSTDHATRTAPFQLMKCCVKKAWISPISLDYDDDGKDVLLPQPRSPRMKGGHQSESAGPAKRQDKQRLRRLKREKREQPKQIEQSKGEMTTDDSDESMTDDTYIEDYAKNMEKAFQNEAVRSKTSMIKFPAPTTDSKAVEKLLDLFLLVENKNELRHTTAQRRNALERKAQELGGWIEDGPRGGSFVATPEGQKLGGILVDESDERKRREEAQKQVRFEQQLAHDPELQEQLHQLQTSISTTSTPSHQTSGSSAHSVSNAPSSNPTPQPLSVQLGNNDRASPPPARDTIEGKIPIERDLRLL